MTALRALVPSNQPFPRPAEQAYKQNAVIKWSRGQLGILFLLSCILLSMRLRFGTNVAIFVLFFGISLLEALQEQDYAKALLWFLLGLLFLFADHTKKNEP